MSAQRWAQLPGNTVNGGAGVKEGFSGLSSTSGRGSPLQRYTRPPANSWGPKLSLSLSSFCSGHKLNLGPRSLSLHPPLQSQCLQGEKTPKPKQRSREQPYYLHCAGTCSCLPPASRCLFQDRKPQHSSSLGARRAHL